MMDSPVHTIRTGASIRYVGHDHIRKACKTYCRQKIVTPVPILVHIERKINLIDAPSKNHKEDVTWNKQTFKLERGPERTFERVVYAVEYGFFKDFVQSFNSSDHRQKDIVALP